MARDCARVLLEKLDEPGFPVIQWSVMVRPKDVAEIKERYIFELETGSIRITTWDRGNRAGQAGVFLLDLYGNTWASSSGGPGHPAYELLERLRKLPHLTRRGVVTAIRASVDSLGR